MSLALSPLFANAEISVLRSEKGLGRSVLATERLAVVESLLPSFTFHDGPPTCGAQKTLNDATLTS